MALDLWRNQLQSFRCEHPGPAWAVHDFDADGLCAAALWKLACGGELRATPSRQHLPSLGPQPASVYLLDLSCPEGSFPWSSPTVVIDHHPPPLNPAPCLMLNSHTWKPPACTSLLTHWLYFGDHSDHAWIAAVGALSDLGDGAEFALLKSALDRWGGSKMRKLTSLINSAHRADGDSSQAIAALLEHPDPAALLASKRPSVVYLRRCQKKVRRRLNEARSAAPSFFGNLAIVQIASDCPVQSIIAQIWRSRLPDHVVLVANLRSDRALVQLSARSRAPLNAIEQLQGRGLMVRGHAGSAGAVLAPEEWQSFWEGQHARLP
jgi:single-stranded-DNA-specific exonuclease